MIVKQPLSNVRILDFSHMIAGPFATLLLSYFGAEIIKVESSLRPDGFRRREGTHLDASRPFADFNRNKLDITLNLKTTRGIELIKDLSKYCDVIVENFSAGVMERLGLTYEVFREIREDIIMVSMPGLGKEGPYANFSTWGPNLLAFTGLLYMWNHESMVMPVGSQTSFPDYIAGSHASIAIMAALHYRSRTGRGQFIEIAQVEAGSQFLGSTFLEAELSQKNPNPTGNKHPVYAPQGCYRCSGADRWCVISIRSDEEWLRFVEIMGSPEWSSSKQFSTMNLRRMNQDVLDPLIEQWTVQHDALELVKMLQEEGIPAGVVTSGRDQNNDVHLQSREFLVEIEHPKMPTLTFPGIPIKMETQSGKIWRHAPLLGQDNERIFKGLLGMNDEEYMQLVQEGVIS